MVRRTWSLPRPPRFPGSFGRLPSPEAVSSMIRWAMSTPRTAIGVRPKMIRVPARDRRPFDRKRPERAAVGDEPIVLGGMEGSV